MPGIFISYRREDTAGHAGRLYDRLADHFGNNRVFMDVAGIEAGVDFVEAIESAVSSCDVLLVMLGRGWLTATAPTGARRLDDPNDFVRIEMATALKRNVRVIPVLVEGATLPPADALPDDLKPLARRQAVELRDSRWDADVEALIVVIEKVLTPAPHPVPKPNVSVQEPTTGRTRYSESRPISRRRGLLWAGGIVGVLIIALVVAWLWPKGLDTTESPGTPPTIAPSSITVYPQVVDERDIGLAKKVQQALREGGYGKVQETEVVRKGRTAGDVRYRPGPDRQAALDIKRIVEEALRKEGYDLSISLIEVPDIKPGTVEIWLPALAGQSYSQRYRE